MAITTFSGPVRSLAGFITGADVVGPSVTDATLAVTADGFNGEIIPINRAAGTAITLPASSGSQASFTFFIGTTISSNSTTIKVANSTDVMMGIAVMAATTPGAFYTTATSDTITMSGSTTGGVAGSYVTVTDIALGFWKVDAVLQATGTVATPFSATV